MTGDPPRLSRRAALLGLAALPACAPRASLTHAPPAQGATLRPIHVATTRAPGPDGSFAADRLPSLTYGRFVVAIPPSHEPGKIALPRRGERADPERHFTVASETIYPDPAAFRAALRRALPQQGWEAVIYVHGYNNTFAEGLYRIAQLGHDLKIPGVEVHFSWPSSAQPLNYLGDRDSALFSRDGLETLIADVRAAGARNVTVLAHSMGAFLVMETLRQIAIGSRARLRQQVDAVVLFSPDLDVELFRSQAERMRPVPEPFVIFTSRRDRALALSSRLTGRRKRLGRLEDFSGLADLKVTVLDVSAFQNGIDNHFALARSPTLLTIFRGIGIVDIALATDRAGKIGLIDNTILTVQGATAIILQPVSEILD